MLLNCCYFCFRFITNKLIDDVPGRCLIWWAEHEHMARYRMCVLSFGLVTASCLSASFEQGWRIIESACLSPVCPGFDSQTRCHTWVSILLRKVFLRELQFSPLLKNQHLI